MQPTLCSRCHKNMAVVFVQRIDNGETKSEGLCLKCAKEMGIKPVEDMMNKMGISDEDLEGLTNEMMSAFGGAEGLEGLIPTDEEGVEDDEDVRKAEKYLPGVDSEDVDAPMRRRRPRRALPPAPDLPPADLYKRYNRGLSFLRLRGNS